MNQTILTLKAVLEECFAEHLESTALWHETPPQKPVAAETYDISNLRNLVLLEHYYNFSLWHVEDTARRTDVDDSVIADCKRKVDRFNQLRNNCMEEVDKCLYGILMPLIPAHAGSRRNTETAGMAIDRLSILALKIYHMDEQTKRKDVGAEHIKDCKDKLERLEKQRADLITALLELITDYAAGHKRPSLYSQFKMYNDPALNPELYSAKG